MPASLMICGQRLISLRISAWNSSGESPPGTVAVAASLSLILSLATAAVLALADYVFGLGLEKLILR